MRGLPILLGVAIAAALAVPANAQTPLQVWHVSGPSVPAWGFAPSAADIRKASAAENPAVRATAQGIYSQLVAGRLNRSHLTEDVSDALTDLAERTLSHRLSELGAPAWSFVENTQTPAGWISLYQLKYARGTAYMTLGVGDDGVVYALGMSNAAP